MTGPVIGWDLDMTLVDSVDGVVASLVAVSARHGIAVDPAYLRATIGLPLVAVIPDVGPDLTHDEFMTHYKEHYARVSIPTTPALPGARAALADVRALGGRNVVVTGKNPVLGREVLDAAGLQVEAVHGELFGAAKGAALIEEGAVLYVGDHPKDVEAATAAGIPCLGVGTGPGGVGDMLAAGALFTLEGLADFGPWLREWWSDPR